MQLQQAAAILLVEANGVTDNPLVFQHKTRLFLVALSCRPVAMAADNGFGNC